MLREIDTRLNEIHECSLNRSLDDDIINVLRFDIPRICFQIVCVISLMYRSLSTTISSSTI